MQNARQIGNAFDKVIVLGAVPRDADGVAFLEGVGANKMRGNLPGDANQRDRIHECVGEARHGIGGPGP